jgi:DMSO/TMAO reductase YedYZ heme-binding membrane subunit
MSDNIKNSLVFSTITLISFGLSLINEKNIHTFLSLTSLASVILLALTLIPPNIIEIPALRKYPPIYRFIAKLVAEKRNFGIQFGLVAVVHSIYSTIMLYNWDISRYLDPNLVLGVIAMLITIYLLITSIISVQKRHITWKKSHAIIWLALPMIVQHAIWISIWRNNEIELSALLYSCLLVLGFGKYFISSNKNDAKLDLLLLVVGTIAAISISYMSYLKLITF